MEDSEHVNETVETFDILTVKKRIKKRAIKKNKSDLMCTPSSTTCKRKETNIIKKYSFP